MKKTTVETPSRPNFSAPLNDSQMGIYLDLSLIHI